ncbi:histidine--tRNA ligase [Mycoplasma phocoeninasale]|uniref:Histidine--tRNA ligase n=1 Tax=Mycoplasma phocoeninasale TaxID=2726117 RepID=A0A858U5C9_9MOLU|nr:histidine--tRNA ligase [Mycoplasma phocoeninasale]QJG66627.1 histidine--tRNA ligase [Mycoplasma phocoeninasale]
MFKRLKGTKDIFKKEALILEYIKASFFKIARNYNFDFIETPIIEDINLFIRSSGEMSDIVSKEMYHFKDNGGKEIALRPEGTASAIRAYVENKINNLENSKLFYFGPMFRHERPQKGRFRQFNQGGVEIIENRSINTNFEIIKLAQDFLHSLRIEDFILEINNLGSTKTRIKYLQVLKDYFSAHADQLSDISKQRMQKNVLRILDDKEESQKDFVKNAPKLIDYLSEDELRDFNSLLKKLDDFEIKYTLNPYLVRGLDYYNDVVFEFVSNSAALGSKSTILGGGRYDGMISSFGGPNLDSIGFAFGVERLMEIISYNFEKYPELDEENLVLIAFLNNEEENEILKIAYDLRKSFQVKLINSKISIKQLFKLQYKYKPRYLIFKELNFKDNEIKVKTFNAEKNIVYRGNDDFKKQVEKLE